MKSKFSQTLLDDTHIEFIESQQQQQQQQQQLQLNNQILEERSNAMLYLAKSVQEVQELFSDMALLVNNQGEHIDNIQINIENSATNVERANKQLLSASKYQEKKRKWCRRIMCLFILVILIILLILFISLS